MIRQYKVLCGKWETLILAENEEDLFNNLVKEVKRVPYQNLPFGFFVSVIELGCTNTENITHFLTEDVLESADFIPRKFSKNLFRVI